MTERYWGKYRGTVTTNIDPEQRGRIQVIVPAVTGLIPSTWAMPCVPFAGKGSGFFVVPQIGAGVWVEYEDGDPDKPIWVGGFWGLSAEVPTLAQFDHVIAKLELGGKEQYLQPTNEHARYDVSPMGTLVAA